MRGYTKRRPLRLPPAERTFCEETEQQRAARLLSATPSFTGVLLCANCQCPPHDGDCIATTPDIIADRIQSLVAFGIKHGNVVTLQNITSFVCLGRSGGTNLLYSNRSEIYEMLRQKDVNALSTIRALARKHGVRVDLSFPRPPSASPDIPTVGEVIHEYRTRRRPPQPGASSAR